MFMRQVAKGLLHHSGKNTGGQAASGTRAYAHGNACLHAEYRVAWANLFARVSRYPKSTGKLLLAHATRHATGHANREKIGFATFFAFLAIATFCRTAVAQDKRDRFPSRIITIAPNSAEIICALGACDRIVGVSKFCVYPPELKKRSRAGGLFDPDLERIVSLRPDLIVLRGKSESLEGLCRERGIELYHDQTDTLAGVELCIHELGRRLGLSTKASSLASEFRSRLKEIEARTAQRKKPRVMLTVARQPDRLANLLTTGKGTFLDEMITVAGGVNVFGDLDMRYPQVSAEAIVAHRPEVIIELMPEVEFTPELKNRLLDQWKVLGLIPAVVTGRIYFVNDDHCLIPSPRYTQIVEKISLLLHPEADDER